MNTNVNATAASELAQAEEAINKAASPVAVVEPNVVVKTFNDAVEHVKESSLLMQITYGLLAAGAVYTGYRAVTGSSDVTDNFKRGAMLAGTAGVVAGAGYYGYQSHQAGEELGDVTINALKGAAFVGISAAVAGGIGAVVTDDLLASRRVVVINPENLAQDYNG